MRSVLSLLTILLAAQVHGGIEMQKLIDSYKIAKAENQNPALSDEEIRRTPYTILVASYLNEKDVISHVDELKIQEKVVYYSPVFVNGQTRYRVCVGKFATREDAEKYLKGFSRRMDEPLATVLSLLDRPSDFQKPKRQVASVPAVSAAPPISKDVFYSLQVGAFPNEELAREAMAKLPQTGQEAFYKEADVDGKKWFRLYVGKFNKREEAKSFQKTLSQLTHGAESFVRKINGE